MLTQEADMARFAASQAAGEDTRQKMELFIRNHQHPQPDPQARDRQRSASIGAFPHSSCSDPLGMTTAVVETDSSGTWVGSSLVWASGRDWARFGQLYLDNGSWNGQNSCYRQDWVKHARTATRGSKKAYGAHWWLNRRKSRP